MSTQCLEGCDHFTTMEGDQETHKMSSLKPGDVEDSISFLAYATENEELQYSTIN